MLVSKRRETSNEENMKEFSKKNKKRGCVSSSRNLSHVLWDSQADICNYSHRDQGVIPVYQPLLLFKPARTLLPSQMALWDLKALGYMKKLVKPEAWSVLPDKPRTAEGPKDNTVETKVTEQVYPDVLPPSDRMLCSGSFNILLSLSLFMSVFLVLAQCFFACLRQACPPPSVRGCSDRLHTSNPERFFNQGVNMGICSSAYSRLPLNEILHGVAPGPHGRHNHIVILQLFHPSHNRVPALVSAWFVKGPSCIAVEENDQVCCLAPLEQVLKPEVASISR